MRDTPDLSTAHWRKSSHSNTEEGACVEVAGNVPGVVPVRDSKDPDGPALTFTPAAWAAFLTAIRDGELG